LSDSTADKVLGTMTTNHNLCSMGCKMHLDYSI
jgi:hypothetical protein